MKIFVDTSAFIALEDRSDALHLPAKHFYETLRPSDRLLTSNYVVDETITRLRYSVGSDAALAFAEIIFKSRLCSIAYVDEDVERAAIHIMRRHRDKKLSFTDCTSMALMARLKADAIFAFDDDFVKVGLRAVPSLTA